MNLSSKYKEEALKLKKQSLVLEKRYSNNQAHISTLNQKQDALEQDLKDLESRLIELSALIEKLDQINMISLRESYIGKFNQIENQKQHLKSSIKTVIDEIQELKNEQSRVNKVLELKISEQRKILARGCIQ
ncbi:MAG: hypothetical protein HWE27_17775 [Gammaproteobacteria bacterium]|nr:hypothetical protein [Gammaproteobacteria bacterium]